MHDWNEPKAGSFNYCLCKKFEAYEFFGRSLLKRLLEIVNIEKMTPYHHVCLRIVYHFLDEKESKMKLAGCDKITADEEKRFQIMLDDSINETLKIKDEESRNSILKILILYLNITPTETYKNRKDKVLKAVHYSMDDYSPYEASIDSISKFCDFKFFELVYLLKENYLSTFELSFDKFIKIYQKFYGEYWNIAIKSDVVLLFHLARKDTQSYVIRRLILKKYSFINMNSTILEDFEETGNFYVIFNGSLQRKERNILVTFKYFKFQFIMLKIFILFRIKFTIY